MNVYRCIIFCLAVLTFVSCKTSDSVRNSDGETANEPMMARSHTPKQASPSNTEQNLTRIVALSWQHNQLSSRGLPSLSVIRPGEQAEQLKAVAVAFGEDLPDSPTAMESGGDHDVIADDLTSDVFRLYIEKSEFYKTINSRYTVTPREVLPLTTIEINGSGRIVTAEIGTKAERAKGAIFILGETTARQIEQIGIEKIRVEILGDLIKDVSGRAIDAEFVRGELPTGDHAKGENVGVQGGTFKSWFMIDR